MSFWFLTIVVFILLLIFAMPRVLYLATMIYYAFKPKEVRKQKHSYHLSSFKESKKKKIVL